MRRVGGYLCWRPVRWTRIRIYFGKRELKKLNHCASHESNSKQRLIQFMLIPAFPICSRPRKAHNIETKASIRSKFGAVSKVATRGGKMFLPPRCRPYSAGSQSDVVTWF